MVPSGGNDCAGKVLAPKIQLPFGIDCGKIVIQYQTEAAKALLKETKCKQ